MNKKVNPKTIKLARDSRGMNVVKAAKSLGVPTWFYKDVENGKKDCDSELLKNLSSVFNYPESFFCQEVVIIYPVVSFHGGG